MKKYSSVFVLIVMLFISACETENVEKEIVVKGFTMGTTYSVRMLPKNLKLNNNEKLQAEIDSLLDEVNRQMSTYINDSEISKFNDGGTEPVKISDDFFNVLIESKKIGNISNGALDITVGPLINLWGFGPEARPKKIPTPEELNQRKKITGLDKLHLDSTGTISKDLDELRIDLSAIAKGFGVDKVFKYLEAKGFQNLMVEVGGEVRTKGKNRLGKSWAIGISTPDNELNIQKVVMLSGKAMATSGDYWNYFEEDDVRYSHTIDPITGRPITHKLASVTVIADECMRADGLATAINVMGPDRGLELANNLNLPVFMIVRKDEEFVEMMNSKFEKYLKIKEAGK